MDTIWICCLSSLPPGKRWLIHCHLRGAFSSVTQLLGRQPGMKWFIEISSFMALSSDNALWCDTKCCFGAQSAIPIVSEGDRTTLTQRTIYASQSRGNNARNVPSIVCTCCSTGHRHRVARCMAGEVERCCTIRVVTLLKTHKQILRGAWPEYNVNVSIHILVLQHIGENYFKYAIDICKIKKFHHKIMFII